MGELRLHALSVFEIRDMFGAAPELAGRLRHLAGERFRPPAPERHERGLLSKLGPLLKRSPAAASVVPDGTPVPADWENLIAGRYVSPERIDVSWLVLDTWIDALDWGTFTHQFEPDEMEHFDFALTKAGLPSRFSLRKLAADDAQLNLRPGAGMVTGYAKNSHVLATLEELDRVVDQVDDDYREVSQSLRDFLGHFPEWTRAAAELNRPAPDLFVVWWERHRG